MPLLKKGEERMRFFGHLFADDFSPPARQGDAILPEHFELWGRWVVATVQYGGRPIAALFDEVRPWFEIVEAS